MYITHVPYFKIQPDFSYSFETWRCLDRARGKGTNALKCDDMKGYLPMQPDFFHCCSQGLHWVLSTGCQSPNIHEFSTKMERSYYRTSHTWTKRVSPHAFHHCDVIPQCISDFLPISFPGRTKPPSTNVAKSRETTLDGEISSLWDRKLAYFSSLRSLDSIRVAWDERGTLLKHFRALFLPKLHLGDPPHSGLPNGCRQHWWISASMWLNRLGMVAEWSCIYLFIHFNWGTLRVVLSQFSIECEPHSKSFLFFPARWLISTIWGPPLLFSFFHPQNPISLPFSPPENPYLRTELDWISKWRYFWDLWWHRFWKFLVIFGNFGKRRTCLSAWTTCSWAN